jgi:hypothetical protein
VHHTADGGFGIEIPRDDLLVQQIDNYRNGRRQIVIDRNIFSTTKIEKALR